MTIQEQIGGMSPEEKLKFLNNNATEVERDQTYTRPLTPEEITTAKEKLAENELTMQDKVDAFEEVKKEHKAELKTLKDNRNVYLKQVKNRQEQMKGNLYHFADQDNGTMTILDKEGNVILERKLRPDERQTSMLGVAKAM